MKLSKKPPEFNPITTRVIIGLIDLYLREIRLSDALSKLGIELNIDDPNDYDCLDMIRDIMRIPYEWTERCKGRREQYVSDWMLDALSDHTGTGEQFFQYLMKENTAWMPGNITPSHSDIKWVLDTEVPTP